MTPIPKKLKEEMSQDPYYRECARKDETCYGRITWEHAFIYAGKQIQEKWAIIPLCWWHHLEGGLDKKENQRIAVARATVEDLAKYPRKKWSEYI